MRLLSLRCPPLQWGRFGEEAAAVVWEKVWALNKYQWGGGL